MAIGSGAIGQFAVGQGKAPDAGTLSVTDLTVGSPSFPTPTLYLMPYPGIDANCVLLLHGDGTNASTTIIDSSPSGHTMTAHNSAQLTTTSPKFGSASMTFNSATSDYIDTPDSADFTLGSGDFTIDFWFNRSGGNDTTRRVAGQIDSANTASISAWHITFGSGNTLGLNVSNGTAFVGVVTTTTVTATGWHHFAGVRTGNVLRAFIDGIQEGGDIAFTGTVPDSAAHLSVGRRGEVNSQYFPGQIDEFRFSVGVARWTADFPPPDTAYYVVMTASDLTIGSPVLDSPAMYFGLTATGLTVGSPVFDTPTLSHHYSVTGNDLAVGSPGLDSPAASVNHHLTASDLAVGSPVFDTPSAAVFYSLTATGLTVGSPVFGAPAMSTGNQLTVDDLEVGSPVLDSPAAAVFYPLVASGLTVGSPDLGTPGLTYTLFAADLAVGSPGLGTPPLMLPLVASDLTVGSPDLDTPNATTAAGLQAADLETGSPDFGTPALSHHYQCFAFDFETGSPELDTPVYRPSFNNIVPLDLETGSPDFDEPVCSHAVMPRAEVLLNLGDTLLDPIYLSMISNPARVFPSTPGLPAVDLLCINHTNGIVVQFGIGVQTVRPAVDVRVRELAIYGLEREDLTNGQVMLWPDTDMQEVWNIETVFPRPGIWGEPSGELRLFLMDRQS